MGYQDQHRGNAEAYASYFAGMDKSMRQKIALISSYFPASGRVADMGSGSGKGSFDVASLYPGLEVIGVDVSSEAVAHSRATYKLPNLSFTVGDICDAVFADNSLAGILNSSVLHHVTSFNDFSLQKVYALLDNQSRQLTSGGILAIRDFVVPHGPEEVYLDLPSSDGPPSGGLEEISTAALFKKFAADFRSSVYPRGGVEFEEIEQLSGGWTRYRTRLRTATEFLLRKDYRTDWDVEILEEYTYFSQADFERAFEERGLRIIVSRPIYNPWILRNRFVGKACLRSAADESPLPFPPTNFIIVGEKTSALEGVSLTEKRREHPATPSYLKLSHYRRQDEIWDVVSRPHPAVDIVPWFTKGKDLFVVCRQSYPRPILNALQGDTPLDGARTSGYINEPIVAVSSGPAGDSSEVQRIARMLETRSNIPADSIKEMNLGLVYYPSAGGINEQIQTYCVHLNEPLDISYESTFSSGFSASGNIRALHGAQTLRSCQVGGMFDSRLELSIYDLALQHGFDLGPWIGGELPDAQHSALKTESLEEVLSRDGKHMMASCSESAGFIEICTGEFGENSASGAEISKQNLEYVVAGSWSTNTISLIPYCRTEKEICVGLERRDLPAPFINSGSSLIVTNPAWRLPKDRRDWDSATEFAVEQLAANFHADTLNTAPLGGAYSPCPALTPETVSAAAALVSPESAAASSLRWVPLKELILKRSMLRDGHLLLGIFRLWHALLDRAAE
ncbi:MAG: class I SAM-dependent methyltransferase [Bdellovibrionales bacterium]|nr:class I SAM-dependent methyltransferase [Bdellovibrionales bacterium]